MKLLFKISIIFLIFITCGRPFYLNLKSEIQKEPARIVQETDQERIHNTTHPEHVKGYGHVQTESSILQKLKSSINTQDSFFYILAISFAAGVLISFTPCVYPMIPITAGILQTQATSSLTHNIVSSLLYVLGIAVVYASLGLLSATTSVIFGQWTSNPIFILFIILLFLYLAFSLFGFYEIRMPQFLTKNRDSQLPENKSLLKTFLLGLISGTIASPCITPALAALLTLVAKKGNPILGFFALFFFAIGMGCLLIIIGTASATLNALPKAGEWMLEIKKILGFLMIAMCIYFLMPLVSKSQAFSLYLALLATAITYYLTRFWLNHTKRNQINMDKD